MSAGHFEGKKHAVRQTQDGWVVSFVVHPNDMAADFATAPLGTRYMVGFAQIGDDEMPQQGAPQRLPTSTAGLAEDRTQARGQVGTPSPALRSEQGKARYAAASDMEKALVRACRLSKDERFRGWVAKATAWGDCTEDDAIQYIRDACCAGESRKQIALDNSCYRAFVKMETTYLIEAGVLPEPR